MSGGDDLESDDEYLAQDWHDNDVEVAVDAYLPTQNQRDGERAKAASSSKRKLKDQSDGGGNDNDNDNDNEDTHNKKKKKEISPKNLLLEAGREIADAHKDIQATFLWTAFTHVLKSKGIEFDETDKFQATHFVTSKMNQIQNNAKYEKSMTKYLQSGVLSSKKRLKKWKVEKSPMVLIVTSSALRAVALLKELSSMNMRVAKLFAKHMNISDQVQMLKSNSYSIGVGTPNRLLKLFETKESPGQNDDDDDDNNDNDETEGALSLEYTELIIMDCHEDSKKFTVCTMKDTAVDLMKFIQQAVIPQMKERKTIKFGMF